MAGQELRLAMHRGEAAKNFGPKTASSWAKVLSAWLPNRQTAGNRQPGERGLQFPATGCGRSRLSTAMASIPLAARGKCGGGDERCHPQEALLSEQARAAPAEAIGAWAGITIENALLHNQARRLAVLEERERIAMDLHDGIIQSIYAVGLALDFARKALDDDPEQARRKIDQAIEGLNSSIGDIRSYISDLRPRQFEGKNLMEGLAAPGGRVPHEYPRPGDFSGPKDDHDHPASRPTLPPFPYLPGSAGEHCQARPRKEAQVHVWTSKDRVLLEVSDNGRGFDLRNMSVTLGHGLSNMHTRAHKVGGM
jgi:signal transduction histidine kinase